MTLKSKALELLSKVTGLPTKAERDQQERIREKREALETRLQRRQINWALDRFTRADKNERGERGLTYRKALERAAEQRRLASEGMGAPQGESLVSNPTQPPPHPSNDQRDELVLRALEADLPVPEDMKTPHGEAPGPGEALTPIERGSFVPRMDEYLGEIIPADISSEEDLARWRELRAAEKLWKKRSKFKGRAPCQGMPIDARGHDWMKVPGQGSWECLCGLEASIGLWNLRDGRMHEVGAYKTTRAQRMFQQLEAGQASFMLPRGRLAELDEGRHAARHALVQEQIARPEVPGAMREDSMAALEVLSLEERTEFAPSADSTLCLNCGSVFESHKEHLAPAAPGSPVLRTRRACPQHGVDAT